MQPRAKRQQFGPLPNHREKVRKTKQQKAIYKARIKTRFHKTLKNEQTRKFLTETPKFYKDIFSKDVVLPAKEFASHEHGETSLVKHVHTDVTMLPPASKGKGVNNVENGNHNQDISTSRYNNSFVIQNKQQQKYHKPNPFHKALQECEQHKLEQHAQQEAILREHKAKEQHYKTYHSQRKQIRKKLSKCTPQGQPLMRNQLDYLLSKINKNKV